MEELQFKEFSLPDKLLQDIYELSGSAECHKGFIIAYANEQGVPIIYSSCDSQMTESALLKSIEDFVRKYSKNNLEISQD